MVKLKIIRKLAATINFYPRLKYLFFNICLTETHGKCRISPVYHANIIDIQTSIGNSHGIHLDRAVGHVQSGRPLPN